MEQQIREINKVPTPPAPTPPAPAPPVPAPPVQPTPPRLNHQNPKLQQHFDNNKNKATISVAGWNLTDADMEIVADVLKTNTVRNHSFFLNPYILLIP